VSAKCVVCGSDTGVILEDASLDLYRCRPCRHVFKLLPPERREQYHADYYDAKHKNWFAHPNRWLFEFIYKNIARFFGARHVVVLDAGCGRGDLLRYLHGRDPRMELHGIDLSQNKAEGIRFIEGDILFSPLPVKYDVVCSLAVIEHTDSPHLFAQKLNDALVPGGMLILMTDNDGDLTYKAAGILKRAGFPAAYNQLYESHHLQCFSGRSLRSLLEANGFEVILTKNHNYPLRAVDLPQSNRVLAALYIVATFCIFSISRVFRGGILQTFVCVKRK
jgi:2-polyprenyl-3-methyl-5-hydroxy-6-metoxy-1,4-benzoquinol methylase